MTAMGHFLTWRDVLLESEVRSRADMGKRCSRILIHDSDRIRLEIEAAGGPSVRISGHPPVASTGELADGRPNFDQGHRSYAGCRQELFQHRPRVARGVHLFPDGRPLQDDAVRPVAAGADRSQGIATPNTFYGATIKGITRNLDYIAGLGCTAIWLSPVLENNTDVYHGYDTSNYLRIDPHFGRSRT
jgi:hypothetical protein